MIQVLHRAFDILELIARDNTKALSLGEIANALQLNHATCANIIKTMVTRNYLEQLGPKKGYKLGYMAYQVVGNGSFEDKLKRAATELMENLTATLNETCLLAILKRQYRLIVHQVHAERDLMVRSSVEKEAYNSASGRLLVALLPDDERDVFMDKYGLPDKSVWPEAATEAGLRKEFDAIHQRGYARQVTDSHILGLACGVREDGEVVASLSVYLPVSRLTEHKEEEILKHLKKTALLLEGKLT